MKSIITAHFHRKLNTWLLLWFVSQKNLLMSILTQLLDAFKMSKSVQKFKFQFSSDSLLFAKRLEPYNYIKFSCDFKKGNTFRQIFKKYKANYWNTEKIAYQNLHLPHLNPVLAVVGTLFIQSYTFWFLFRHLILIWTFNLQILLTDSTVTSRVQTKTLKIR